MIYKETRNSKIKITIKKLSYLLSNFEKRDSLQANSKQFKYDDNFYLYI